MLGWLRQWRQRRFERRVAASRPDPGLMKRIIDAFPVLQRVDQACLERRVSEILAEKSFQPAADLVLEEGDRLAIAALAALPILELGIDCYRNFHTIIVYPAGFVADVEEVDEAGVMHTGRDLRSGEAWAHGPVVLALDDVLASGQGEGFNVVVHEMVHQIDQINGDMDGFPPLRRGMDPQRWARVFTAGFERLNHELDTGQDPSIDPYAAESPAEFLAVASEFYFDVPEYLHDTYPEVYRELEALFGEPGRREAGGVRREA